MVFYPWKIVIFHSYVSSPEGITTIFLPFSYDFPISFWYVDQAGYWYGPETAGLRQSWSPLDPYIMPTHTCWLSLPHSWSSNPTKKKMLTTCPIIFYESFWTNHMFYHFLYESFLFYHFPEHVLTTCSIIFYESCFSSILGFQPPMFFLMFSCSKPFYQARVRTWRIAVPRSRNKFGWFFIGSDLPGLVNIPKTDGENHHV